MADYYSILKKTLSGLPKNTAENRNVVYGKARQAIDRQLRALDPTPPEEAIARQMNLLEQAIATVEAEFAAAQPATTPAPEPSASTSSVSQPETPRPAAPSTAPTPQASPEPAGQHSGQAPEPQAPPPSTAPQGGAPTTAQASTPGTAKSADTPAYDAMLDELDDYDRSSQGRQRVSALGQEKRRGGWFVTLVVSLVVLAILAAGGYAMWRNKDALLATLGLADMMAPKQASDATAEMGTGEEPATSPGAIDGKEDVRLNQNGETVAGQPSEEVPAKPIRDAGKTAPAPAEPATGEPVAGEPAAGAPIPGTNESAPQAPETPASEQPAQVNPVGQNGEGGTTGEGTGVQQGTTGDEAPATSGQAESPPAIAQKAYLYEEGGAGAGATRDNAAIVWSLEEQSPGDGLPPEAVIHGQFDVPGRGLVMNLTIRRNVDEALPASHIIELRFDTPADFSGGEIDNVARFVMKSSEQARGEGLIAVPAKIDAGYFLIALNNLAQAQETNRKLLTESTWIDIPIGYTSGRRALVTLEKGAIGEKVFKEAFADWDKR